jgi:hypothetical protein
MSTQTSPKATPPRRGLVTALVVIASVIAFLAIFAVWVNRQVLNTDEWTETSSELLEKETIRTALATFLVDELYSNVDVPAELQARLPADAKPLAGPLAGGLREFAQRAAIRALESPRVQLAWEEVNSTTHEAFVAVVEDKGNAALTTDGGDVVLHLREIVERLADYLGLSGKLVAKLPPDAGELVIMRSDQLDAAQKVTKWIKGLAVVLPLLWIGLAALAVYLAHGRRRQAIRAVALGALAAGILALLARGAAGNVVTDALAKTAAVKPAIDDTWTVGTSLLTDVSQSIIAVGILLLLVAWLAGETRPAVAFRRAAAPYMRERPDLIYGVAAVLFLILVVWQPADIFKRPLALLLLAVLTIVGVEALRRQTAEEFPDATLGGTGIRDAIGSWWSGRSRSPSGGATTPENARLDQLERLAALRDRGALSQAEFDARKAALLG